MSAKRLSFNVVVTGAARDVFTHPSYLLPALVLLAPTLALQLAAPSYLRTRLAPSTSTVAVGAVLLVWLTQVALPASCALVHARRAGIRRTLSPRLMGLSLVIGTRVTLGLAALLVPGLWLQARYAFAPLLASARHGEVSRRLRANTNEIPGVQGRLLLVACSALLLSIVGQSAIAAVAEAMNTITPGGHADGQTLFELHFLPHAFTTLGAYVWNAGTLAFHALCVSALFDEARGVARVDAPACDLRRVSPSVRAGQLVASATAFAALVATIYKIQQHLL